jgi:hypothetical protein
MNWRNRAKEKLVLYKGGKCEKCGYDNLNYLRVFEFHHIDSSEKDFTISGKTWSFERLRLEVDKCILLCSNCHKEIHEDLDRVIRKERLNTTHRFTESGQMVLRNRPIGYRSRKEKLCQTCGAKTRNLKFCSQKCNSINNSRKPSMEVLLELKKKYNNIEIGKQFGVSEAAVRKWIKELKF